MFKILSHRNLLCTLEFYHISSFFFLYSLTMYHQNNQLIWWMDLWLPLQQISSVRLKQLKCREYNYSLHCNTNFMLIIYCSCDCSVNMHGNIFPREIIKCSTNIVFTIVTVKHNRSLCTIFQAYHVNMLPSLTSHQSDLAPKEKKKLKEKMKSFFHMSIFSATSGLAPLDNWERNIILADSIYINC